MNFDLKPIPRRSTVEQVVDRIRSVIEERKLAAGQRLPGEHELVEQLQVSRSVLREALARLQGQGLVKIQRGRGTYVADSGSLANCVQLLRTAVTLSPQELISYTELRTAIEIQAVRQAAERATAKDITELETLLKALNSTDKPYPELLEIDCRFHRKLIEVGGNVLMQNLMEVIFEFVMTQMVHTTPAPQKNQLGQKLHRDIFTAIKSHNPDAAEQAMRNHMQAVLDRLNQVPQKPAPKSRAKSSSGA